jgi:hypothetical protein
LAFSFAFAVLRGSHERAEQQEDEIDELRAELTGTSPEDSFCVLWILPLFLDLSISAPFALVLTVSCLCFISLETHERVAVLQAACARLEQEKLEVRAFWFCLRTWCWEDLSEADLLRSHRRSLQRRRQSATVLAQATSHSSHACVQFSFPQIET